MPYNFLYQILNETKLKASVSKYRMGSGNTWHLYYEDTFSLIGTQLALLRVFYVCLYMQMLDKTLLFAITALLQILACLPVILIFPLHSLLYNPFEHIGRPNSTFLPQWHS
jgi:hypothetical protein